MAHFYKAGFKFGVFVIQTITIYVKMFRIAGNICEDLFRCLSIITLNVTNNLFLADKLLQKVRVNTIKTIAIVSPSIKSLYVYNWKGNMRELKLTIEHDAMRCRGNGILLQDVWLNKIATP